MLRYYYIIKNNSFIKYTNLQIPQLLNDKGKLKIKEIVEFIKDLPIDFLETKSNRILKETEMFPFIELLPIILEILISQDLAKHQVYFCFKILQNLFALKYTINNMERALEKIYLKYLGYYYNSTFILECVRPFKDNMLIKFHPKSITEWYGAWKFFEYFSLPHQLHPLSDYKPTNEIEEEIKKLYVNI